MEVTYSAQWTGYEKGRRYANARFFSQPRAGVTKVRVVGNWPAIVEAYEALGVHVEVVSDTPPEPEPRPPVSATGVDIPVNWQNLPWSRTREPGGMTLRGLVKAIGGTAVNAAEARELIERAINGNA